jgi:hypothetical protein
MNIHDKWTTILIREPYLANAKWTDDKTRAFQRAYSLCELHSCQCSVINASRRIYVFAKAYYAPAKGR